MTEVTQPAGRRLRVAPATILGLVPYALVGVLFVVNVATIQGFSSRISLMAVLVLSSFLGIASIGQTFAVIMGAVDLSVPAVIGLSDVVITQLYGGGWSFWLAALVILGLALAIGVLNALATVYLRVHSLITTIGMGLVISGGVLTWRSGFITGSVPLWLTHAVSPIGKTGPIAVPEVVFVWLAVSVVAIVFQRRARLGRELYALGSNPVAAPLAKVRGTWTFIVVFCISAVCGAVTGVLIAGFSGTADQGVGQPYLFETLTAVVIGGTSLLGGRGGYGRTIAGALILTELTTLLVGLGFDASMQQALLGILIIVLVVMFGRESHLSLRI
jgi:ribose transport system permease protein